MSANVKIMYIFGYLRGPGGGGGLWSFHSSVTSQSKTISHFTAYTKRGFVSCCEFDLF